MLCGDLLVVIRLLVRDLPDLEHLQHIRRRVAEGDALASLDDLLRVIREVGVDAHLLLDPVPGFHVGPGEQGRSGGIQKDDFDHENRSLYFTVPVPVIVCCPVRGTMNLLLTL